MRTFKFIIAAVAICYCCLSVSAQKTHSYLLGVGHTDILDTYLSPEKYRGTDFRFVSLLRCDRDSSTWSRLITHEGNLAFADNRSGNGGEMGGGYTFNYALRRKWQTSLWGSRLSLMAGGAAQLEVGFLYNTRGSNNPAQARLSLQVGPNVALDYNLPFSQRHPLTLHYDVWAPLAGIMFSPNYGQSYYEIFSRGNYDHNVVPTTFIATPCLRQMLTVDFRLIGTTWRMGYLGDIRQAKVNNLKWHSYTHSFVIGFVKGF